MKSDWNKIILTIDFCAFSTAVAIANDQMQPAPDSTNFL
jgi:hypothetical protein